MKQAVRLFLSAKQNACPSLVPVLLWSLQTLAFLLIFLLPAKAQTGGSPDASFNASLGSNQTTIFGIILQPDGKILLRGGMSENDVFKTKIIRLNADGSPDTGFQSFSVDHGEISSFLLQADGKILLLESLTEPSGTFRTRIVRLNLDGSLDTGFISAVSADRIITTIALQADGKILVSGSTSSAGVYLMRLNANGSLDTGFQTGTGPNSNVGSIVLQADGKILIGGSFTGYNGTSVSKIARLNPDGSLDSGFKTSLSIEPSASIKLQADGKILVKGNLTNPNTGVTGILARLNADGSFDSGFQPLAYDPRFIESISTLALQADGKILLGGTYRNFSEFPPSGVEYAKLVRLNRDGTRDTNFQVDIQGAEVSSVLVQPDGKILAGGLLIGVSGTSINGLTRLLPGPSCTNPSPTFTPAPTCLGSATTFTDESFNVAPDAIYQWDIDNNGVVDYTTRGSISHTYTTAGYYTAKLTIQQGACQVSSTRTFPVSVRPNAPAVGSPVTYCQGATATALTATATADNTLRWYNASGNLLPAAPLPSTSSPGSVTYSVSQVTSAGCESARSSITVMVTAASPDYQALADLYVRTNGANWKNNSKWLTSCTPCSWQGVLCNPSGRVISLTLDKNNLVGTLPASLSALTALRILVLSNNQLSGGIPQSWSALTGLQLLDLQGNALSGSLAGAIPQLTNLESLNLSNNQLNGSLPNNLGNLTKLDLLFLTNNQLTGSIPASLSKLTQLQALNLQGNRLSGTLLASLSELTKLKSLYLSNNQFSGAIPASLGNLSKLAFLCLNNNKLSGSIPASLGSLNWLLFLDLSSNQLSGCLPASLKGLCGRSVNLSSNSGLPGGGNFSAFCSNGSGGCPVSTREGIDLEVGGLQVSVLGNPVVGSEVVVDVQGAAGQPVRFQVWDLAGKLVSERFLDEAAALEQQRLPVSLAASGLLLLRVSSLGQTQTLKVVKAP